MRIALALILLICSCFSGLAEAALPEVTDAASFAEACTALNGEESFSSCAFSDPPSCWMTTASRSCWRKAPASY